MGAWGAGSFQNDTALDWVAELTESEGADLLHEALEALVESEADERDADMASAGLAAAEVVAAALGQPSPDLPAEAREWLEAQELKDTKELAQLAQKAVKAVRTKSELKDLWEETSPEEWLAKVKELESRLQVPAGYRR